MPSACSAGRPLMRRCYGNTDCSGTTEVFPAHSGVLDVTDVSRSVGSNLAVCLPPSRACRDPAIISSDVAHNLWFFERYRVPFNWMLAAQGAFLVFVLATFPTVWRSSKCDTPDADHQS